jgi:hypothetical protein
VKDLFKDYMKLDPGHMAELQSIIGFPWSIKLFYGMISDNIPIMGSKRKSYVVMLGFLQFISLIPIFLFEI